MNICFICRNILRDRGGIETYTLELGRALVRHGHKVYIISEYRNNISKEAIGEGIDVHTIDFNEHPFPGYWMIDKYFPVEDFRFAMAAAKRINQLAQQIKIDIVESTDYFRSGFWYALNRKTPFILRLHGWFFNRQDGRINPLGSLNWREKLLWRMQQKTIDHADMVSAVSTDFADFASQIWKIPQDKLRVILNAVDVSKYTPNFTIKKEMSVLYVGRLIKNKGVLTLADAIPEILGQNPEVKFVFAGKDMYLKEIGCKASEYILKRAPSSQIVFLGEISPDELLKHFRQSAIVVVPSFYESSGLACLEAMACGSVVVASEVGGMKDMIKNEEQGLLVPVGNSPELAKAVIRLFQDNALRENCSKNAVQKVVNDFNYDKLVCRTIAVYREAINHFERKS